MQMQMKKSIDWEVLGFHREENKQRPETHRPKVEVLNMASLGNREYKPEPRPTRKPIPPPKNNPHGLQRPTWENQRKAIQSAVNDKVRNIEKEKRIKEK